MQAVLIHRDNIAGNGIATSQMQCLCCFNPRPLGWRQWPGQQLFKNLTKPLNRGLTLIDTNRHAVSLLNAYRRFHDRLRRVAINDSSGQVLGQRA